MSSQDDVAEIKCTIDVWAANELLRHENEALRRLHADNEREIQRLTQELDRLSARSFETRYLRCNNCELDLAPADGFSHGRFVWSPGKAYECEHCGNHAVVILLSDGSYALEGCNEPTEEDLEGKYEEDCEDDE